MKASPIAVALLAGSIILAPATAWADDTPPATWDEQGEWFLDCDTATWNAWTIHYEAEQIGVDEAGQPLYGEWVEVGRELENLGSATGDSPDSDCPNWVITEDGSWTNTTAHPPHEHPAPPLHVLPEVENPAKVGLAVEWKHLGEAA